MLDRRHQVSLAAFVLSLASPASAKCDSLLADVEQTLRQWKVEPTAAGVMSYLRSQTLEDSDRLSIERWIAEMGSDRFADRERATQRIKARGEVALPYLRRARGNPDLEIVRRAG